MARSSLLLMSQSRAQQLEEAKRQGQHVGGSFGFFFSCCRDDAALEALKPKSQELLNMDNPLEIKLKRAKYDISNLPDSFICPISQRIMERPITLSTGHTYDRDHLLAWAAAKSNSPQYFKCPNSGKNVSVSEILMRQDTIFLKEQIKEFVESVVGNVEEKKEENNSSKYFYCDGKLMEDPITLSTGHTYDRNFLIDWAKKNTKGNNFLCPNSRTEVHKVELDTGFNVNLKSQIELKNKMDSRQSGLTKV